MCFLLHVEKYLPTNIEDQPIRSSKLSGCASKALISSLAHREKCRIDYLKRTQETILLLLCMRTLYTSFPRRMMWHAAYDVARGV